MTNKNTEIEALFFQNEPDFFFRSDKTSINEPNITKNCCSSLQDDSFKNVNFISKKTNRGRKEKYKIPSDKPKCEVCLEFAEFSKESVIKCSDCGCIFHKSCHNQYEEISSKSGENISFRCMRCIQALKQNKSIKDFKCFICNHSDGVLKFNRLNKLYYHQICLDNLDEFKGLKEEEISKEKIKKWRFKNSCKYCGQKLSKMVAVTKCKNPKCKEYYHLPCAIVKGVIFNINFMRQFYKVSKNNEIPFYCSNHNKKISNKYKEYINNLINSTKEVNFLSESIEKKLAFPDNNDQEEKPDEDNDEKIEEIGDIWRTISSKSIKEIKNINYNCNEENTDNMDNNEEKKENNDTLSINESYFNINNDIFKLDFEEAMKENSLVLDNKNLYIYKDPKKYFSKLVSN